MKIFAFCLALLFAQGCATASGALLGGAGGTLMGATLLQPPTEVNVDTGAETTPPFNKTTMLTSAAVGAAIGGIIGMIIDIANMDDSPSSGSSSGIAEGIIAVSDALQQGMDQDLVNRCAAQGMAADFNTRQCVWGAPSVPYYGGSASSSGSSSSEDTGGRNCNGMTDYQCAHGYYRRDDGALIDNNSAIVGDRHSVETQDGYKVYTGSYRDPQGDIVKGVE